MHEYLAPIHWPPEATDIAGIDVVSAWLENKESLYEESAAWKWRSEIAASKGQIDAQAISSRIAQLAILERQLWDNSEFKKWDSNSYKQLLRGLCFLNILAGKNHQDILNITGNGYGFSRLQVSNFIDVASISVTLQNLQNENTLQHGTIVDLGSGTGLTLLTMTLLSHTQLIGLEAEPQLVSISNANKAALAYASEVDLPDVHFVQTKFNPDRDQNSEQTRKILNDVAGMYVYAFEDEFEARIQLFENHAQSGAFLVIYMHTSDLQRATERWYANLSTQQTQTSLELIRPSADPIPVNSGLPEKDPLGIKSLLPNIGMERSAIILRKV